MSSSKSSDLKAFYTELECWKHPSNFNWDSITHVEAHVESIPDGDTGYALAQLADGRWATFWENQDYSGHG